MAGNVAMALRMTSMHAQMVATLHAWLGPP
jgi:hypothetical protein